jgi:F-type H+-transporting ATPase subunit b
MLDLDYSLAVQALIFVALWLALKWLWFDPALRVLKERSARSQGQVAAARELEAEVARLRQEHDLAIQQAKAETQREVAEMLRRAEAEQKQLIAQANEDAQHTLADVRGRVAEEVAGARKSLTGDVGAIAREVARVVVGRAI